MGRNIMMHLVRLLVGIALVNLLPMVLAKDLPESKQLVVVSATSWDSTTGTLKMLSKSDSQWTSRGRQVPVVLGKGLAWGLGLHEKVLSGPQKKEGDGRTPAGIFSLGPAFGYTDTPPKGCRLEYRKITPRDYFVDDPAAAEYNQWVTLSWGINPKLKWHSAEKMMRPDNLYELGIVIHHNMSPTVKGAGSAIFFHIWRNSHASTSGCTAMSKKDLIDLMTWLEPDKNPIVVESPEAELPRLLDQIGNRN